VMEVDYTYDPAHGNRLIQTDDKGDGTASAPELCTSTFYGASSTAPQMMDYVDRERTISAPCGTTPNAVNTVSDSRSLFDGASDASFGQIPGPGDVTSTEVIDHYDGSGNPVYVT